MNVPSTERSTPSNGSDNNSVLSPNSDKNTEIRELEKPDIQDTIQPWSPPLDPYNDARAFIRLLQCQRCSQILHNPVALPCGETLCRSCLPETYDRQNISYPNQPERIPGFTCPYQSCSRREHPIADCGSDITLSRILDNIANLVEQLPTTSEGHLLLEEVKIKPNGVQNEATAHSCAFSGGRLVATYKFTQTRALNIEADVRYTIIEGTPQLLQNLDKDLLERVAAVTRPELDCQICYNLLLYPITTDCGHTFCRGCLERVLDHSNLCPICRRTLPPFNALVLHPVNKQISDLLNSLCPEILQQRMALEDIYNIDDPESWIPIFVCTLSFPTMPMFIHIFEPRYRLLIRRALESPSRSFGMVDHNRQRIRQGENGEFEAPFLQYGIMLHIRGIQILPDGRSLIETVGIGRFKILTWENKDGYTIAKVERVEDIPTADEESMESMERMFHTFPEGSIPEWARLPTSELLQIGLDFVATMRRSSTRWFHDRVLRTYGQPPTDPALFPYWLATLLPVNDDDRYLLLRATSVRERLKIVVGWIKIIEQRHCDFDVCARHFAF